MRVAFGLTRPTCLATALLLLTGCGTDGRCDRATPASSCADLRFDGRSYDEWRPVDAPPPYRMQEVGDASYPACNNGGCDEDGVGDLGATDVWLVDGIELTDAVIGLREDSGTYVIFVRRGVDLESLRPRIDPSLLE